MALTAAAALEGRGFICVPGTNPALPELLNRSWRIIDSDIFMATRSGLDRPDVVVAAFGADVDRTHVAVRSQRGQLGTARSMPPPRVAPATPFN